MKKNLKNIVNATSIFNKLKEMFFYLRKNPESNHNETFKISTETINEKHKNIPKFVPYHFISSTSTHGISPCFLSSTISIHVLSAGNLLHGSGRSTISSNYLSENATTRSACSFSVRPWDLDRPVAHTSGLWRRPRLAILITITHARRTAHTLFSL